MIFERFFSWLLICVAVLVTSCNYEPVGSNFKAVDKVKPPEVTVTVSTVTLSTTKDTIYVFDKTLLRIYLDIKSQASLFSANIKATVNDVPYSIDFDLTRQLYFVAIDTRFLQNDSYKFRLNVALPTGSNSLASAVGAEQSSLTVTRIITVDVDNTQAIPMKFETVEIENGKLTLRWKKYPNKYLIKYILRVTRQYHPLAPITEISYTLPPSATLLVDSSYVGGEAQYTLDTYIRNGGSAKGLTSTYDRIKLPRIVKGERIGPDQVSLTWKKCLMKDNFQKYEVYVRTSNNPISYKKLGESNMVTDTSIMIPSSHLGFGGVFTLSLVTSSNKNDGMVYVGQQGETSLAVDKRYSNETYKEHFLLSSGQMRKIFFFSYSYGYLGTLMSDVKTDSVQVPNGFRNAVVTPDKSNLLIVSSYSTIVHYKASDLTLVRQFQPVLMDQYNTFCKQNDNSSIWVTNSEELALYDFKAGQLKATLSFPRTTNDKISDLYAHPIFNKVWARTTSDSLKLLEYSNGNLNKLSSFSVSSIIDLVSPIEKRFLVVVLDSTPNVLYIVGRKGLVMCDESGVLINTTNINQADSNYPIQFDKWSNWFGFCNESLTKYFIFDLLTGNKIKELDTSISPIYGNNMLLEDRKLYTSNGFYLDLN